MQILTNVVHWIRHFKCPIANICTQQISSIISHVAKDPIPSASSSTLLVVLYASDDT